MAPQNLDLALTLAGVRAREDGTIVLPASYSVPNPGHGCVSGSKIVHCTLCAGIGLRPRVNASRIRPKHCPACNGHGFTLTTCTICRASVQRAADTLQNASSAQPDQGQQSQGHQNQGGQSQGGQSSKELLDELNLKLERQRQIAAAESGVAGNSSTASGSGNSGSASAGNGADGSRSGSGNGSSDGTRAGATSTGSPRKIKNTLKPSSKHKRGDSSGR